MSEYDKNIDEFKEFIDKHKEQVKSLEEELDPRGKKSIKDTVKQLNEKFLEAEFITPDHIYIDLPLLKDLHLGTLFSMIRYRPDAQELYTDIKDNLKDYQLRLYDDPLKYFKKLNITEEEYLAYRNNPKYQEAIFTLAPYTLFHATLRYNLKINAAHSYITKQYKDIPLPSYPGTNNGKFVRYFEGVNLYINIFPFHLSEHSLKNLQCLIGENLGVNVIILNIDIKKIKGKFFSKMDEIYAYSLDQLLQNKELNKDLSAFKFIGKRVFTPLLFKPEAEDKLRDEKKLLEEKNTVTAVLQILCFFKWLEAARYSISLQMYENEDDERSDEEIRELPLPNLSY